MTTIEVKQQLQSLLDERAKVTSVPHVSNMEHDLDYIQATERFVSGVKELILKMED